MLVALLCGCGTNESKYLERDDWADDVKNAVNDFIDTYGVNSDNYDNTSYVVFDFDNTASVFDVEEQPAIYERDYLGYDLAKANAAGDTLYVLQGRDENGMRTFRNSNKMLILGSTEEKLFKNDDNEAQLSYIINNKMSVKDAIDTFAIKTEANEPHNQLGFKYGFLKEYGGYHQLTA